MKGFELCQKFFEEIGLPAIEQSLSECVPRLAVGLSGGSQSHGNDDEIIPRSWLGAWVYRMVGSGRL